MSGANLIMKLFENYVVYHKRYLTTNVILLLGKVLVSSEMGVSRPAVLVAAYLMIFHHMTIVEALMTLRKKRAIYPNDGFMKQLRKLNEKLLEERQQEDVEDSDDETSSQSSVIRAECCSLLAGREDSGSIMGAKVHSIMVEEEDTTSLLGSVMSASSIDKRSLASKQPTLISEEQEEQLYEDWRKKQGLPARELSTSSKDGESKPVQLTFQEQEESEEDRDRMIQEWQCRNEKYQMESYLFPKEEGETLSMSRRSYPASDISDSESVCSHDIRVLKQQLEASGTNRMRRGRTESVSTESSWDMWNERMMEIEKEAAQKYCSRTKCGGENLNSETGTKGREVDEESLLSDTSSLYNFCQKNKDKLTALERWKVKRIQFGFHKRDSEASEQSSIEDGSQHNKETTEGEEKNVSDINLTAYQAWKSKHQKKVGNENKEEIVEIAKGEDSASARRKQRRMEILEHSKKVLEESQSLCSWEAESTMSGSVPLSAFWTSPSSRNGADDAASLLSLQTNRSSLSQARSGTGVIPTHSAMPSLSIGPENTISIASIQNWIANVVSETIAQKQNEILTLSRPPSVLASSVKSGDSGRHLDDDKTSLLSGQNGLPLLGQKDIQYADTQSNLSCNTSMSRQTVGSSSSRKVTQTSKPLYSLFADEVDLKKLGRKEREMQMEMKEKMSDYQTEKLRTDNKRSTLFKKKKVKGDDENETEHYAENTVGGVTFSMPTGLDRTATISARSISAANVVAINSEVEDSVSKWLQGLKEEEKSSYHDGTGTGGEKYTRSSTFREADREASSYRFCRSQREETNSSSTYQCRDDLQRTSSRFSSASSLQDKGAYTFTRSRFSETSSRDKSPEPRFPTTPEPSNSADSSEPSTQSRIRSHHVEESEEESSSDVSEFGAKRKFTQSFAKSEQTAEEKMEEKKECFASRHVFKHRQRTRKEEEEEEMNDEAIIAAWRNRQQETKAKLRRRRDE